MAEEKSSGTLTVEGSLPDVVASLEMLSVTSSPCDSGSPLSANKRILRKRIRKVEVEEVRNRRCSLRPKKRSASDMEDNDIEDMKRYYLNRNVRQKTNNLETIFEEADDDKESVAIPMSARRFKRLIHFQNQPTEAKIKKRRAKVKRIFGSKFIMKHRTLSMQTLINQLNVIRSNPSSEITDDKHTAPRVYNAYMI